jgi:hypothetical protein
MGQFLPNEPSQCGKLCKGVEFVGAGVLATVHAQSREQARSHIVCTASEPCFY